MKTIHPLLLIIAGIAITVLFSFKFNTPQKEFLTIKRAGYQFHHFFPDGTSKKEIIQADKWQEAECKILNQYGKEGWELKGNDSSPESSVLYLERTKQ